MSARRPGGEPGGDLGDDLRRVLRRDAGASGAGRSGEDLLARVHAGAARRRTRRAAGMASLGVVAAGTALAVTVPVLTSPDTVPAAAPSATTEAAPEAEAAASAVPELDPGREVDPADVRVRSVTAASAAEYWVLGEARCDGAECLVVGHTADAAKPPRDFRVAPGPVGRDVTLRMSSNGDDGWVVNDGELYATHDSADSWERLEPPMERVDDVVTSAASVWLTGTDARGRTVVATAPSDADEFSDTRLPPELGTPGILSEPVLTQGDAGRRFGFLRAGDGYAEFVAYEEAEDRWQAYGTADCEQAGSLSATETAMWAICARAEGHTPMVSDDGGRTWALVDVDGDLRSDPRIAAIDPDRALVSTGIELYVLSGDQLLRAEPPAEGAGSATYEHMRFNEDGSGFLVDADGNLSRTVSGGASWEPVELP